jgi:hypothetical protein
MHNYLETFYLAGLWKDNFIQDLCWRPAVSYCDNVPLLKPKDAVAGMPSWSLMSICHPIGYAVANISGLFEPSCKLVGGKCLEQAKNSSSFTTLAVSDVVLEGKMIEMELTFHGHWKGADASSAGVSVKSSTRSIDKIVTYDAPLIEADAVDLLGTPIKTARRAFEGEELNDFMVPVICLEIGRWTPAQIPYALEGVDHHFLLVLAPSITVPGAYERLGMTDRSSFSSNKDWAGIPPTRVTLI